MLWPRREHHKTQPRQQAVQPRELVGDTELPLEDAEYVAAAERADTVFFGRPVEHALPERLVVLGWQRARSAGLLDRSNRTEAVVAVGVAPSLHEAA